MYEDDPMNRYGRRRVLLACQLMLFVVGVAIGMSPSFQVFALFKLLVGIFQQGVVTGMATMVIELFPLEARSLTALVFNLFWACGTCSMAAIAFLLRHQSWRALQYTLSAVSLATFLLQLWLVDESLRWLMANGRVTTAMSVVKRAARANRKDVKAVLDMFHSHQLAQDHHGDTKNQDQLLAKADAAAVHIQHDGQNAGQISSSQNEPVEPVSPEFGTQTQTDVKRPEAVEAAGTEKLSMLDLFRHKRLLVNALITFTGWFAVAFVLFTLILMSTSFAGDPHLNYFLAALMDIPPCIILYFLLDRIGRKRTVQMFFALAGFSVLISAVCRSFKDNSILDAVATAFSLAGVVGGSGALAGLFFYTPEYFPTNLRNQAIGISSAVGRIGGMIAPFMKNLAMIVVWAPGAITGSLCVGVLVLYCFLPETKQRELPTHISDIKAWYSEDVQVKKREKSEAVTNLC